MHQKVIIKQHVTVIMPSPVVEEGDINSNDIKLMSYKIMNMMWHPNLFINQLLKYYTVVVKPKALVHGH